MAEARPRLSEDWLAVWGGLLIFALSLGVLADADLLGWGVKTQVWMELANALAPVSKTYAKLPGVLSLLATYGFLLAATALGARALRLPLREFVRGFTAIFWISYVCWIAGSYAYIAATPDKLKSFGIPWSLNLTAEAGFIIALVAGLIVGNFFPRFAETIRTAIRPEWYIKTAIVILGGVPGHRRGRAMGIGQGRDVPRTVRHRRSLPDLLGAGVLRGAEVLQVQPRMGRAAGLRHLHLRRLGGHCHRRGDQGPAGRADHGVVAGGDLRGGRVAGPSLRGTTLPLSRTDGRGRVDGIGRENRRRSGRRRSDGRFPDPGQGASRGRRVLPAGLDHGRRPRP